MKEELGKKYVDGQIIIEQDDVGDCMYVIQSGSVVVFTNRDNKEIFISELAEGDFFGEMALFEPRRRAATVRAKGEAIIMTIDKKTLLRRIQQDPTMAFHIIEKMSSRIRHGDEIITRIKGSDRRNWEDRPEEFSKEDIYV